MRIKTITLHNYRLYQGTNTIKFDDSDVKNIFVISGQNGFGKTTFLQSLLWCLYGKLMVDIDETIKKEISNLGGYGQMLLNNLNQNVKRHIGEIPQTSINDIKKNGYSRNEEQLKQYTTYYVSIDFANVFIPSIPCHSLKITRSYDVILDREFVEILIDGMQNELTQDIGNDIFINDFILNKDIARFFFFDSERIVALAETKSIEEKRKLSSAYHEVLGVKKYEDLKKNLENVRLRFRKRSADLESRDKLTRLIESQSQIQQSIAEKENQIIEGEKFLSSLRKTDEEYQIQLLREGYGVSMEELRRQESIVEVTKKKDSEYKQKIKTFLDYAPLAIAGKLLYKAKEQIEHDYSAQKSQQEIQNLNSLVSSIIHEFNCVVDSSISDKLVKHGIMDQVLKLKEKYCQIDNSTPKLINISKEDYKEFISVYNNIISTYKIEFEHLADDYKKNKQILERASRKVANMQSSESDELIKSIRKKKNEIEKGISSVESKIRGLYEQKGVSCKDLTTINKQISELSKKVSVDDSDTQKDVLSEQLIKELDDFLISLKQEKKVSLEWRIKNTLNSLMHKTDFVQNVKVRVINDGLDIDLINSQGDIIPKDSLSKGEQQLYATSLLKSLVDESGISFPVFIDSPLQKFDKSHSNKIITEFYPSISKQVVLFPLLHKELTQQELDIMKPYINTTYLIKNNDLHSYFQKVDVDKLMED